MIFKLKFGLWNSFVQTSQWFPTASGITHSSSFLWLTRLHLIEFLPTSPAYTPAPAVPSLKPTTLFSTSEPSHLPCFLPLTAHCVFLWASPCHQPDLSSDVSSSERTSLAPPVNVLPGLASPFDCFYGAYLYPPNKYSRSPLLII